MPAARPPLATLKPFNSNKMICRSNKNWIVSARTLTGARILFAKLRWLLDLTITLFPRSAERGSIEAIFCLCVYGPPLRCFHVRLSVAPLKHPRIHVGSDTARNRFHVRLSVAPLKRVWSRCAGGPVGRFHVRLSVAPLKRPSPRVSCPSADRFPRSAERGSIEASSQWRNADCDHRFPRSAERGSIEASCPQLL